VYLNRDANLSAIISDTDLILSGGIASPDHRVMFDLNSGLLRAARLGHGGFSPDGKHFTLVVGALPGKLLQIDAPAFLSSDLYPGAARYPELPAVNGRHVFSPSGDFFLSYPGTGFPMGIVWNLIKEHNSIRVRAGGTFALPGFPSAEAVDHSGDLIAVGIRRSDGGFGLFMLNRSDGNSFMLEHPQEITRLAFALDGRSLWLGDSRGGVVCVAIAREPVLQLSAIAQCELQGGAITALAACGTPSTVICGTSDGTIHYGKCPSNHQKVACLTIGRLDSGHLCSVHSSQSGEAVLIGFSAGNAALYRLSSKIIDSLC
jgi:hypothetical protein